MEVVLGSSCEEAGSTDGISIAAGPGCTRTHTHRTGESTQICKNLQMCVQLCYTKAHIYTDYTHTHTHNAGFRMFFTFTPPLSITLSHCSVTDEHIPASNLNTHTRTDTHINNLMHFYRHLHCQKSHYHFAQPYICIYIYVCMYIQFI